MKNELVVIIDPQKDFIAKTGHYTVKHPDIEQITIAKGQINQLIRSLHETPVVVVYSDYHENQFGEGISMCIPGTEGHEIDIDTNDSSALIAKTNHSCFSSAGFVTYLTNNGIDKLLIGGFLAEYCVRQTALDALERGYAVALIEDCIGTGDDVQYRKNQALSELIQQGAGVIHSSVLNNS